MTKNDLFTEEKLKISSKSFTRKKFGKLIAKIFSRSVPCSNTFKDGILSKCHLIKVSDDTVYTQMKFSFLALPLH